MSLSQILVTGLLFSLTSAYHLEQGGYYHNRPYYGLSMADAEAPEQSAQDLEEQPENEHPNVYISRYLLKRNVDILNDPRFLNCIGQLDIVNNPGMAMPAYARCASLMGRPRFGKRSGPSNNLGVASMMMKPAKKRSMDYY